MSYLTLLQMGDFGGASQLIMFGLIFVVFYFFIIRPQNKKMKAQKNFRESLNKGDRIVTTGGIHGKVQEIRDTTILLDCGKFSVTLDKSAISQEASAAAYGSAGKDKEKEDK